MRAYDVATEGLPAEINPCWFALTPPGAIVAEKETLIQIINNKTINKL